MSHEQEAMMEFARNAGMDNPDKAWILTPFDVWVSNPFYHGPEVPHPEADMDDLAACYGGSGSDRDCPHFDMG